MSDTEWTLARGEVHVWHAMTTVAEDLRRGLFELLSARERERAARFKFPADRNRFIGSHGLVRLILARYAEVAPQDISFEIGAYGKPFLPGSSLQFNVSDSGDMAAIALTQDRDIGIDVEHIRPGFAGEEIAERFFSSADVAAYRSLSPEEREHAFFRIWTRKEAYIKAIGEGLSHPLHTFDVSLERGAESALLATRPDPEEASRWTVTDLSLHSEYPAALAVQGRIESLKSTPWNDWRLSW